MSFRNRNAGKALLPFGLDYSDVLNTDHGTEKPQLVLPVNGPVKESEELAAKQSISFANLMSDGPFYTGSLQDMNKIDSKGDHTLSNTAPDGIQRYSDKYKKAKKIGRTIEEHPYQLEFFPDELYSVMGISNKQKKKLLSLSTFKSNGGLAEYNISSSNGDEADMANSMLEKLKSMAEELDDGNENKEDDADEIEEDIDDEFDEDEDDDYNAEKYFDDGDDDGMDAGGDEEAAF
ncbi:DNA-directed RNA polymerase III subunit, HMG-like [Scheffersomyces stipitis CBS 6054]|uniref:DNA-directed RNA polymerase III subunit n=1 Tax=Scheffersomyces stipitis (strain ATCC 58785 / CBS 6054 / NBRC 10063 / NRRL Y-11545) TaxID=322104 RepID=A3LR04_PICST|nr:DNA-directed RNA polymerase III subunit, HMG-like [Scheffersomyces stipitis CBS 6054]ABN65650.1 DNA-directed RNA polymerase III subunit, HMG-like [Scheffersomyces stipitis CBS 6054]